LIAKDRTMTTHTHTDEPHGEGLPEVHTHPASTQRSRSRRIAAIVALLAALIAGSWLWSPGKNAERGAIQQLPAQERHALYDRTLQTLESDCAPAKRPKGLDTYCAEQATFIQQFPECDQVCAAIAQRYQGKPTR
jgi:hypothetical protein